MTDCFVCGVNPAATHVDDQFEGVRRHLCAECVPNYIIVPDGQVIASMIARMEAEGKLKAKVEELLDAMSEYERYVDRSYTTDATAPFEEHSVYIMPDTEGPRPAWGFTRDEPSWKGTLPSDLNFLLVVDYAQTARRDLLHILRRCSQSPSDNGRNGAREERIGIVGAMLRCMGVPWGQAVEMLRPFAKNNELSKSTLERHIAQSGWSRKFAASGDEASQAAVFEAIGQKTDPR